MNEISDEDIVRMFHSGNGEEKAFRLLVGKYSERLYWHIRKIVIGHEDSDDVLQNTFIKIWKGLREFRYEAKLFTWMYRVATNEAINFLSEKRRKTYGNSQEITPMLENCFSVFHSDAVCLCPCSGFPVCSKMFVLFM